MGIYKELQKLFGSSVQNYIIAARTAQGYEDWRESTLEERLVVVGRWHEIQIELGKEKQQVGLNSIHGPQGFLKKRHKSFDDRRKTREDKKRQEKDQRAKLTSKVQSNRSGCSNPLRHARTYPTVSMTDSDNATFEEAIQTSVAATSQGDSEQDKLIERAIRASVLELQSASREGDNDEAIQRAIQASIVEATRARTEKLTSGSTAAPDDINDHDHEEQLKLALHRSISMHDEADQTEQHPISNKDFDDSGIDTDDDENMKSAIDQSKMTYRDESLSDEDTDLQKAIQESIKAHEEHELVVDRAKAEENEALKHVERLSLEK